MNFRPNKAWWLLGMGMVLGAGAAHAANAAYDEAKANITKATALLGAITPAASEKPGEAHQRKRAIRALERAKLRIACAQAIADGGKPGCPAAHDRFDDNDDDDDDHKGHHHKDDDSKKKREEVEKKKREEAEKQKREEVEKKKREEAERQKKK